MKLIITLSIALVLSSCATILQGGPDRVYVTSQPEGARIFLDDQQVGVTPLIVPVSHESDGHFRLEEKGEEPILINRGKAFNGWMFGNLILGGVVGVSVDLILHNEGHFSTDPINVEWKKP